jgi:hypothetical protein
MPAYPAGAGEGAHLRSIPRIRRGHDTGRAPRRTATKSVDEKAGACSSRKEGPEAQDLRTLDCDSVV